MEKSRNTKVLQYITIVLLVMNAIVTSPYDWGQGRAEQIIFIILAVAMVFAKPPVMVFASIISLIIPIKHIVTILIDTHSIDGVILGLAGPLPVLIYWILVLIAATRRKTGKVLCILGTIIFAVMSLLLISVVTLNTYGIDETFVRGFITRILFYLGMRCSAMVLIGRLLNNGISPVFTPATKPVTNNISLQYDQLTQLKELLDSGTITQEEFDEKKKQLLGL